MNDDLTTHGLPNGGEMTPERLEEIRNQLNDGMELKKGCWYPLDLKITFELLAEVDRLKAEQAEILREYREAANGTTAKMVALQKMVDQQAEDDGLWFDPVTAPEAYLQQELRKLHEAIEGAP